MKKLVGFTLIELVSVMVILGIMAAVAVPRFVNLTLQARIAAVNGMLGAVQSASTLAHAQALAEGQTGATGSITMEGQSISLVYGYPAMTPVGISAAMSNISGFTFSSPGQFILNNSSGTALAGCEVDYTNATASTVPGINITTSGC